MSRLAAAFIAVLGVACSLPPQARAELDPLRPLPVLDAGVGVCPPNPAPHPRDVRLITRESMRHDVGPYSAKLPGYATNPAGPDSYTPFLIDACRGDTLRIQLANQLAAAYYEPETNLHTHGLIVRPTSDMPGPPGDYIYLIVPPGQTENYRIPIPADLPGTMFGKSPAPQPYPSGLYWFHAHRHEFARAQVQGGDAGVLSIGNPLRVDYRDNKGMMVSQNLPAGTRVEYLGLRDIQLAVPHGLHPSKARGQTAQWLNGQNNLPDYNSGLCDTASAWFEHAACGVDNQPNNQDYVWLFTVNGQNFPQIAADSHQSQLWRIANLSANATYVLEIAEGANPPPNAPVRPFIAVSLDGVVAGTPVPNTATELLGVTLRRLLLMPGARAEIFLPANGCGGVATLRTVGLQTGPGGNPAPTGDPWPAIDLARLRTTGNGICITQPPVAAVQGLSQALTTVARPAGLDIRIPARDAALSGPVAGATAQAMLRSAAPPAAPLAAPGAATPTLAALHPGCRFLPEPTGSTSYRRRITFAQDATNFMLGSEIVDATGTVFPGSPPIGPEVFPATIDWLTTPHVCPVVGAQEVWELVNNTDEMHNFHIHQTKFRLADASLDLGVPPGLKAVIATGPGCTPQPATAAFCDPLNVVGGAMPGVAGNTPDPGVDTWHDTIPVPPRDAAGHPGRVFVSIPFKAPLQEGRFVFHCHILEHEDGGMMAPVELLSAGGVRQQQVSEVASMGAMKHGH